MLKKLSPEHFLRSGSRHRGPLVKPGPLKGEPGGAEVKNQSQNVQENALKTTDPHTTITPLRILRKPPSPRSRPQTPHFLRPLVDTRTNTFFPQYQPLLGQLSFLGRRKQALLCLAAARDLEQRQIDVALAKFRDLARPRIGVPMHKYDQLVERHREDDWTALERLVEAVSTLPAPQAAKFATNHIDLYLLPKVVTAKYKRDPADARQYIHALSKLPLKGIQLQAVNLAIKSYLHQSGPTLEALRDVLAGLDPRVRPRIYASDSTRIHRLNSPSEMLEIWHLFQKAEVPLDRAGMSTFLRALFTCSDQGERLIKQAAKQCRYSPGFYHFLVRVYSHRQDKEFVDWLFTERVMPLMESNPDLIPVLMQSLLVRTLEFEGFEGAKSILNAMGAQVSESSWRAIFRQFRKIGVSEKALDTVRRAVDSFGLKLSFPFVNEYLLLVSQHFRAPVYFKALLSVFPEHEPVLTQLQLIRTSYHDAVDAGIVLLPRHRDFPVAGTIHESTLSLTYDVVLNEMFSVDEVVALYETYENYCRRTSRSATMAVADRFVSKLISLHHVNAAEAVYKSALLRLPLRKPSDGHFGNSSAWELVTLLAKMQPKRAVELLKLTGEHSAMPLRSKTVRKLYYVLKTAYPQQAAVLREWAVDRGADPEKPRVLAELIASRDAESRERSETASGFMASDFSPVSDHLSPSDRLNGPSIHSLAHPDPDPEDAFPEYPELPSPPDKF